MIQDFDYEKYMRTFHEDVVDLTIHQRACLMADFLSIAVSLGDTLETEESLSPKVLDAIRQVNYAYEEYTEPLYNYVDGVGLNGE